VPSVATDTNTDGWSAVLGQIHAEGPRLELWLDRFTGYPERKFFACFRAESRRRITAISKQVNRRLWPVHTIEVDDINDGKVFALKQQLRGSQFNSPIRENYSNGKTFYGIYDPTKSTSAPINEHFVSRAVAFFEDVIRSLPGAAAEDEHREIYPRCESRRQVASHLRRERSKLLAAECKIRDGFECQACGFRFEMVFGKLGAGFAEAHHLVPLARLRETVLTQLEDLVTVCSNCHRMLHRMDGNRGDLARLQKLVKRRS
jgi:5-methylcytosine-specific restriction endonuclease McrA